MNTSLRVFVILSMCIIIAACSATLSTNQPTTVPDKASGTNETKILAFNDGNPNGYSSPWGDNSVTHTPKMAVKFSTDVPCELLEALVFVRNESGKDLKFALAAYADSNDRPDESSPLFGSLQDNIAPQTLGEWVTIDVPDTSIASGSFWIVVEWQDKPLRDQKGQNSFYLGYDKKLDFPERNLRMSDSSKGWVDFPSVTADMGDTLINVKVLE